MAKNKLKIDARRSKIIELLEAKGKVNVNELSTELAVTPATIRTDLAFLENDKRLIRMSGGAMLIEQSDSSRNEKISNLEAKKLIAQRIASTIKDGDTLFINSGTTTLLVAEELKLRKNLNIVTNSLSIAEAIGEFPTFRVILLGGLVNSQYGFTYGSNAEELLERFRADWAILSVDGINKKGEVTTYHAEEAILDRKMISRAKKTVIAADSSKIDRTGFSYVCSLKEKMEILTERLTEKSQKMLDNGINIKTVK